jgi:hypothetical protein
VRSFSGSIDHLIHCHPILLASSSELDFPFMVWIVAPAFLGCWAMIVLAIITHFQSDDQLDETKLHTLLVTFKNLMLIIPPVINLPRLVLHPLWVF